MRNFQSVGCQVPWDTKRDVNDELCTTSEQIKLDYACKLLCSAFQYFCSRAYISSNNALKGKTKTELTNYTNCLPPCHFWRYTQIGDPHVRNVKEFGKSWKTRRSILCSDRMTAERLPRDCQETSKRLPRDSVETLNNFEETPKRLRRDSEETIWLKRPEEMHFFMRIA